MSGRPIEIGSPYHELIKPIPRTAKAALLVEILVAYARVRWLLWRRDLPSVVASLRGRRRSRPTFAPGDRRSPRAGGRTDASARSVRLPLPRPLARLDDACSSRRGIASTLVIGVDVDPAFSAHAWVESGGRALLPPLDDELDWWSFDVADATRRRRWRSGIQLGSRGSTSPPRGSWGTSRATPLPAVEHGDVSLDDALDDILEPASGERSMRRCVLGRERIVVAARRSQPRRAKRRGHAAPIPATLRYPGRTAARVAAHQERVILAPRSRRVGADRDRRRARAPRALRPARARRRRAPVPRHRVCVPSSTRSSPAGARCSPVAASPTSSRTGAGRDCPTCYRTTPTATTEGRARAWHRRCPPLGARRAPLARRTSHMHRGCERMPLARPNRMLRHAVSGVPLGFAAALTASAHTSLPPGSADLTRDACGIRRSSAFYAVSRRPVSRRARVRGRSPRVRRSHVGPVARCGTPVTAGHAPAVRRREQPSNVLRG